MAKATTASNSEAIRIIKALVDQHDKIIVRGNGEPSLLEDVRTIKRFCDSIRFWITAIGLAFLGQAVATIWYFTTQIYPLMVQLQTQIK